MEIKSYQGEIDLTTEPFTMCSPCWSEQDQLLEDGCGSQVVCDHNWKTENEIDRATIAKRLVEEYVLARQIELTNDTAIIGLCKIQFMYTKNNDLHTVDATFKPTKDTFKVETRSVQNGFCSVRTKYRINHCMYIQSVSFTT